MARDRDDEREIVLVERGGGSRLGPLMFGLALGVGLGLLFAPTSGEETRRTLRRRWRRLRAAAEEQVEDFGERLHEGVDRLRSGAWLPEDEEDLPSDRPPAGRGAQGSAREEIERRLTVARARRRAPGSPPSAPPGQEPVA